MCVNTLRVQMHFYIYLALLLHRCIESCMYIRMQVAWFSCLKYVCMYVYIYIYICISISKSKEIYIYSVYACTCVNG